MCMSMGERATFLATHECLCREWKSSPLAWSSEDDGARFLGFEIYHKDVGYHMSQQGFVTELLRHHAGSAARAPPLQPGGHQLQAPQMQTGQQAEAQAPLGLELLAGQQASSGGQHGLQ